MTNVENRINLAARKELRAVKKNALKEIKRLDKEIKECIRVLNGYEQFILEGTLYVRDRNNLIDSIICGIHNARMTNINCALKRLSSSGVPGVSSDTANAIFQSSESTQKNIRGINATLDRLSDDMTRIIPEYSQNINRKLDVIRTQKQALEQLILSI